MARKRKWNPLHEPEASVLPVSVEDIRWACQRGQFLTRAEAAKRTKAFPRGTRGKAARWLYDVARKAAALQEQRRAARYVSQPFGVYPRGYKAHLVEQRNKRLLSQGAEAIQERHLTTPTCSPYDTAATVTDYDRGEKLWVIHVEQTYHYSNTFGDRYVSASWLCGRDENGVWAVRVPGTLTKVTEAVDWITPGPVKKAVAAGRQVIRQGDVYFVQKRRGPDNLRELPWNHHWDPTSRTATHRQHGTVHVPFPCRVYAQYQLHSSRSGAWRRAAD